MLRRLLFKAFLKAVSWPIKRRVRAFERACDDPRATQEALLRRILARQARTAFARDHGFATIRSVADFRRQVPVAPYEYIAPYIDRVRKGEESALLSDRPLMFALTSGTTAARKFIPVTPSYLEDYRRLWNVWGLKVWQNHRQSIFKPIVQLAGDPEEFRTESGVACGAVSGFTALAQKRFVRRLYCVPGVAARLKEAAARYYVSLRFSLPRQPGMLLAANPSTLVALARAAHQNAESLVRDIRDGTLAREVELPAEIRAELTRGLRPNPRRAAELEAIVARRGELALDEAWPSDRLVIGTWTGGSVGPYVRQLPRYYGPAVVRDLGLIASEGRFTLPLMDGVPAGVLDVTSHYFEFVPESEADKDDPHPTTLAAHELELDKVYSILPTTSYGLYRYRISDLVKVVGFFGGTPVLEFLGKGNRFANLTGEKLSEHQVVAAMSGVTRRLGLEVFTYSLAPVWRDDGPYYGVFVERGDVPAAAVESFLDALDIALGERNIEYQSKRESRRLGPVRLLELPPGTWLKWDRERLARAGGPAEQYKHPCLLGDVNFRSTMPVEREVPPADMVAAS
jgi:hypothetical protein